MDPRSSLLLLAFSLVLLQCAESCIPHSIQAAVPQKIMSGHTVYKVDLTGCGTQVLPVKTSDPDFYMQSDGTINTLRLTTIPLNGRTFSVWLQDLAGHREKLDIWLFQEDPTYQAQLPVLQSGARKRYKRRWSPPPFEIEENQLGLFPKDLDEIGSDSSVKHLVYYNISGPGVNQEPFGLFSMDKYSGLLRVHRPVDREQFSEFKLLVQVFDRTTGEETDKPLTVTVNILDVNDNPPTFSGPLQFSVMEQSRPGTVVGKVNATDRDEPLTDHSKIHFSLLSANSMFLIHPMAGVITIKTTNLDREVKDTHLVIVEIKDMNGRSDGLASTATATVILQDINDNPPTFAKESFTAKVKENQMDGLILHIPVEDKDQVGTANWRTVYTIIKGNENGTFKIETDPKTNQGLLFITKALDYEKTKKVGLVVQAQNEVDLVGTTSSWVSVPVDVEVLDVDEGPEFSVQNLYLTIDENTAIGTVIGTYTATDPETQSSKGIRYYKLSDPALWVNVSENTGELRIAGTVDRESRFVQHSLYNVTVRAVDTSSKSATGTVIIKINDVNDNVPDIPEKNLKLCETEGELGSVVVIAEDRDDVPFADPFIFELADGHDKKWTITGLNGTAALLQTAGKLPLGHYTVSLVVRDQQGMGKEQEVTVRVCRCMYGDCLPPQHSTALGLWGLLATLLGITLLLFCVFLTLICATKPEKVFIKDNHDSTGILVKSNTEGPGEEVHDDILVPLTSVEKPAKVTVTNGKGQRELSEKVEKTWQQTKDPTVTEPLGSWTTVHYHNDDQTISQGHFKYTNLSSFFLWKTNCLYINKKLNAFVKKGDDRYADDILHFYGFEGQGSPAGSVGCCSDFSEDHSLDFLDSLGPKFKTLAEVCTTK